MVKQAYINAIAKIKQVIHITKVLLKRVKRLVNILNVDMDFYSEEEIIVTNGASEALDTSLRSIIEPGDEIFNPWSYLCWIYPIS